MGHIRSNPGEGYSNRISTDTLWKSKQITKLKLLASTSASRGMQLILTRNE